MSHIDDLQYSLDRSARPSVSAIHGNESMMIHIGFTGTRDGMSSDQLREVTRLAHELSRGHSVIAHHGCCVGSDAEFHRVLRRENAFMVGHPALGWPNGKLCAAVLCDFVEDPAPPMTRNQAIVDAVSLCHDAGRDPGHLIATPLCGTRQRRSGTWATIRMALRSLRAGRLRELYVVGRDGELLDHSGWGV